MPLADNTEKTAAASVDDTIAPSNNAIGHARPSQCATTAVAVFAGWVAAFT